jgi:hypothetical protein
MPGFALFPRPPLGYFTAAPPWFPHRGAVCPARLASQAFDGSWRGAARGVRAYRRMETPMRTLTGAACRGLAFVDFPSVEAAQAAMAAMHGRLYLDSQACPAPPT